MIKIIYERDSEKENIIEALGCSLICPFDYSKEEDECIEGNFRCRECIKKNIIWRQVNKCR